jgi:hypothetical protein
MAGIAGMVLPSVQVVETRCARASFEELDWLAMLDKSSDDRYLWLSDSSER